MALYDYRKNYNIVGCANGVKAEHCSFIFEDAFIIIYAVIFEPTIILSNTDVRLVIYCAFSVIISVIYLKISVAAWKVSLLGLGLGS